MKSQKQLKILTAVFWFGVAGVVLSFAGSVTTAVRHSTEEKAIIEANPIPVPALPAN